MSKQCVTVQRGFTLVEILVTVSLFALIMTVLLSGLFIGTKAWAKADAGLTRAVSVRQAVDEFVWDVEHLHFEAELKNPVLSGELDDGKRPVARLRLIDYRPRGIPTGSVQSAVWQVEESASGGLIWTRTMEVSIGDKPLDVKRREVMLENVKSVKIEYGKQGKWSDDWKDEKELPDAARISVVLAGVPLTEYSSVASITGGGEL